jgi:hypothetical protein
MEINENHARNGKHGLSRDNIFNHTNPSIDSSQLSEFRQHPPLPIELPISQYQSAQTKKPPSAKKMAL